MTTTIVQDSLADPLSRARRHIHLSLMLALGGALFSLAAGLAFGSTGLPETLLIALSGVVCLVLVAMNSRTGAAARGWIPGIVTLYFMAHLLIAATLGFARTGDPAQAIAVLIWVFPLLCLHNFGRTAGQLAQPVNLLMALGPPVLLAALLPWTDVRTDAVQLMLLIHFALAFVAFVVLLDLFARDRKAHAALAAHEDGLRQSTRAIAASEARYRRMVDLVPVVIREEDWTLTRDRIRALQDRGTTDIAAHFHDTPDSLAEVIATIRPGEVNLQGRALWQAADATRLADLHAQVLQAPQVRALYAQALADFAAGRPGVRIGEVSYDVGGVACQTELKLAVPDIADPEPRAVVTEMDITDARRSDALLGSFARATSDVIYNLTPRTDRHWWSARLQRCFGHDPADFMARRLQWADLIHPEDRDRVLADWAATTAGTAQAWRMDYRFARADGSYAHVRDHALLERNPDGTLREVIGSMDDISDEIALQEKFLQAQKLESIGRMAGGIAHDFNNLLTVVIGNAEMLEERLSHDPAGRTLAERARAAAERAEELASRLLSFARRQRMQPVATDVAVLMRRVAPLADRTLGPAGTLDLRDMSAAPPALVDPEQLESAILNICRNAGDAMPAGGTLTVTIAPADAGALPPDLARSGGTYVALSLADTGIGMDAETRARAIEPFFTTKDSARASGLGLSMVYGFARQSQGALQIASEPGAGTTVTLFLPAATAA